MLYCMSHSWHVIFIGEVANIDVHRRTGLIGVRVMDQESLELVRQTNDPIRTIIKLWLLQLFCDTLDLGHD
jgi:hypothetical protein